MNPTKKPSPARLTLVDIGRWTLEPRAGLESLLATGHIELAAVRKLLCLVELVRELGRLRSMLTLDAQYVSDLLQSIDHCVAIDEDKVGAVLGWLDRATNVLRATRRDEYRKALCLMVKTAELRVLMHAPAD